MKRFLVVILSCLLTAPVYGAFGTSTIWQVSSVSGVATNGGAFDPGVGSPGTDESQTATAITLTTASTTTATCSPACSATTHGPGNFVHIASGTGCTVGWHEIISQAAGTVTFDAAIAAAGGDTCVGTIGGPIASPSTINSIIVGGNHICIKADGTYSVSAPFNPAGGTSAAFPTIIEGYTTTCGVNGATGDRGQATIQATATGLNGVIGPQNNNVSVFNFVLDCNSQINTQGIFVQANGMMADNLLIKNCLGAGGYGLHINGGTGITVTNTRITGGGLNCPGAVLNSTQLLMVSVQVDTNACPGFISGGNNGFTCIFCIAANNSGASSDGFQLSAFANIVNSAAYGNGRDGVRFTAAAATWETSISNTWFWGNVGFAMNASNGATAIGRSMMNYNAYVSGGLNNLLAGPSDVTLTVDPSVAGASLNFALNATAGGGAALKAVGFPGVFVSSTGFLSIGPIQPNPTGSTTAPGSFGFVQ